MYFNTINILKNYRNHTFKQASSANHGPITSGAGNLKFNTRGVKEFTVDFSKMKIVIKHLLFFIKASVSLISYLPPCK